MFFFLAFVFFFFFFFFWLAGKFLDPEFTRNNKTIWNGLTATMLFTAINFVCGKFGVLAILSPEGFRARPLHCQSIDYRSFHRPRPPNQGWMDPKQYSGPCTEAHYPPWWRYNEKSPWTTGPLTHIKMLHVLLTLSQWLCANFTGGWHLVDSVVITPGFFHSHERRLPE